MIVPTMYFFRNYTYFLISCCIALVYPIDDISIYSCLLIKIKREIQSTPLNQDNRLFGTSLQERNGPDFCYNT